MQSHQKFVLGNICSTKLFFIGDSNEHLITNMLKYKNYPEIFK